MQLTESEQLTLELCATRRALIAANRATLALMERENDAQEKSLREAIEARASAPASGAEVVELRQGGPVPVEAA